MMKIFYKDNHLNLHNNRYKLQKRLEFNHQIKIKIKIMIAEENKI